MIRIKTNYCDFKEFKKLLDIVRTTYIVERKPFDYNSKTPIGNKAFLDIGKTKVILTAKISGKLEHYIFRLDEEDPTQYTDGGEAYKILKQYVRDLPDLREDPFYRDYIDNDDISTIGSISAVADYNPIHNNTRIEKCYGYDLNSAWPYFMCQPIPDTSKHPRMYECVGENEIGFDTTDNGNWRLIRKGMAQFVFPLIESPFKKFVKVWYNKKKNAKSEAEKAKAKGVLNYSIGYLQRINPFLRAIIICRANEYINSLIRLPNGSVKSNVVYWNTDSIVSTIELPELDLGPEIGQWKLEHVDSFAMRKTSYQWGYNIPKYKGVSKGWFKKKYPNGYDILRDDIPNTSDNIYRITEKLILERVIK